MLREPRREGEEEEQEVPQQRDPGPEPVLCDGGRAQEAPGRSMGGAHGAVWPGGSDGLEEEGTASRSVHFQSPCALE